ncbi:MAG: nucleotidyltransferase domain-containing protein [Candidatus Tectomicrobia bacterium]|uniref:Nucleotidyltransferase domain-containing protein n=1 Tax=Tectimicrobiota bacterium TaxID=2528274 RepID=A0A932GS87_UNCTE|nr:nucleotidyltransferase domain-containing protein [Candidatus Tectomicrobia bacterium]
MDGVIAAQALDEVRRIIWEVVGKGTATVYLFGSWARGDAGPNADIDLAIEAHAPLPRGTLALLRERLEESHVPYRVDVVNLEDVDPDFRRRVLEEGIRWSD